MSQNNLIIIVKDDPFSDRAPRLITSEGDCAIADLVSMAGFDEIEAAHCEASINGERVPAELWAETPARGHVQLAVIPQGGDDGNKILRTVLSIAVIVASFYLGGAGASALASSTFLSEAAAGALITSVASTIGQLAINAIVPPPSFNEADQPDPVYFIEGARNQLRPYAPIDTVFGTHRVVPSLAARPYPEIIGDDTYYYLILLLGPIGVEVADRKVGDTPIENFDEVVWQSRLTASDPHPTMASRQVITEGIGATLLENDPELRRTATDVIDCDLIFAFPEGLGKSSTKGDPETNSLIIQVRYREVVNPGAPDETLGDWRFASQRVNTVYPDFRGFDDFTTLDGGGVGGNANFGTSGQFTFSAAKPAQPFFRQIGFSFPTKSTYEVEVLRVTTDRTEARVFDNIVWQTMLSKREDPAVLRDDIAYEVYRFKGTEETSGAVDEINMRLSRIIPTFPDAVLDQADLSGVTAADLSEDRVSSNPWELLLWANRMPFEARLAWSDDQINWPSFAQAAKDARDRGLSFDYFLQRDIDVDELSNLMSMAGEGRAYSFNNVLTAGLDRPILAPSHVFRDGTARNISSTKTLADEVHAYRVQFNDAQNGYRTREVIIYVEGHTDQTATRFEDISILGKTDWTDLHDRVAQLYRNSRLQAETLTLEVPIEAVDNTLRPMSRVSVATRAITTVRASGVIREVEEASGLISALTLDQEVDVGPSQGALALSWVDRTPEGEAILSAPQPLEDVLTDGVAVRLVFDAPVDAIGGPAAKQEFIIGPVGDDLYEGVLDRAEQAGDHWLRLYLKDYAPERFNGTGFVVPDYEIEPVTPLLPRPPALNYISFEATEYRVVVNFTMATGHNSDLREIRVSKAYAAPLTDPDPDALSAFEQMAPLSPEARQIVDAGGNVGQRIVYRLRAIDRDGKPGPLLQTPILTVTDGLPVDNGVSDLIDEALDVALEDVNSAIAGAQQVTDELQQEAFARSEKLAELLMAETMRVQAVLAKMDDLAKVDGVPLGTKFHQVQRAFEAADQSLSESLQSTITRFEEADAAIIAQQRTNTDGLSSAIDQINFSRARIDKNESVILRNYRNLVAADQVLTDTTFQLSSKLENLRSGQTGNSSALQNVSARVRDNEGLIELQSQSITALRNTLDGIEDAFNGQGLATSGLSSRVSTVEDQVTIFNQDIVDLRAEISGVDANYSGLATAVKLLEQTLKTLEGGGIELDLSEVTQLSGRVADLNNKLLGQTSILDAVQGQVKVNEDGIAVLNQKQTNLQAQITGLDDGLQSSAEAFGSLEAQVIDNKDTLASISASITNLNSTLNNLPDDGGVSAAALGFLTARVEANEEGISTQSQSLTQLENDLTTLGSNLTGQVDALNSFISRVETNEDQITTFAQDITQLKSDVASNSGQFAAFGEAMNAIQLAIEENGGSIDINLSEITDLSAEFKDLKRDTVANADAYRTLSATVSNHNGLLQSISQSNSQLISQVGDAEAQVQVLGQAIADIEGNQQGVLVLQTNAGTGVSRFTLMSNGVAPDTITLDADQIKLNGQVIVTGWRRYNGGNKALDPNGGWTTALQEIVPNPGGGDIELLFRCRLARKESVGLVYQVLVNGTPVTGEEYIYSVGPYTSQKLFIEDFQCPNNATMTVRLKVLKNPTTGSRDAVAYNINARTLGYKNA